MFEEVKEMIDSTVYTNGNGEVTAKNMNLALHGIVDATADKIEEVESEINTLENKVAEIEENGVGGGGALRVWVNEENTPEQIAENVATYNALLGGEHVPVIMCERFEQSVPEAELFAKYAFTVPVRTLVQDIKHPDGHIQVVALTFNENDTTGACLMPDGTIEVYGEESPSEGGSGLVYVDLFEDGNAEEQLASNKAAFEKIVSEKSMFVLRATVYGQTTFLVPTNITIVQSDENESYVQFMSEGTTSSHTGDGKMYNIIHNKIIGGINSDGTIDIVDFVEEPSTPASSGPLRVWLNEGDAIIDDDKISENVATYNSIAEGTSGSVVFMAEYMEDDGSVYRASYNVSVYEYSLGAVSLGHGSRIHTGDGVSEMFINAVLYPDGTTEITIA